MKFNLLTTTLLTTATLVTTMGLNLSQPQVQAETETKFICATSYDPETEQRNPTTFAWTPRGKVAVVRWSTEYFLKYSPQRRCQEVSPRFHKAYHNDTLGLMTNGTMNNQPVICTAKEAGGACDTLLMTLRPEDNSLKILNHFRRLFNGEQVGPVKHAAGTPQVYYRMNIEEFLRTAPVEE
ncbi:MAG: COP23 domain-containing protein [Xenococcaceae cyanobacterium MO_207.B15]|nr:COP23 domain-containing protein [Xenococcaceae cyanobacterium MO_207.B15]